MGETFYSVLGVDANADSETIRRAYRDRVKEGVSEGPVDRRRRWDRLYRST